ncbi:Collagen alpha-3(VI) chain [Exaiptasia diaphana]|nr:Collagen alpha-3(VI) chain [Exaiptasia diaphana]
MKLAKLFVFPIHDGIKVTPDKGNTGETQITNRVKRSTSNISPDVLDSIRVEVRNQVLNLTASLFCQAPDKTCVRGAPGMRGLRGRRGSRGRRGRPGPKGTKGLPGKYGKQGFRGPPGLKGQKGDIGNPGPPGLTGPKGDRGEKISQPSALVSPSTLTVTENQTATFHCNAHGNPKPKITWKKEYGKIDIGKARIDKSGLFEISNVDENDTGNYTCTAKNVLGEDARTISVLVRG